MFAADRGGETAIARNAVRRWDRMNHLGDTLGDFRGELMIRCAAFS